MQGEIVASQANKILYLEQELAQLKRMIFGARSERFIPSESGQQSLFDNLPAPGQGATERITYERKKPDKKKPVRLELPAHLPRAEEVIEPTEVPSDSKAIGQEITEMLEYSPGSLFVRKIVRPKYALARNKGVIIADMPSLPIVKGNAAASLLAHIIIAKFVDHLPFYRQGQMFRRQGVTIPESTLGGWFNQSCKLIVPVYQALVRRILDQTYLQADESPIAVQDSHKKGATHRGYMWVYHAPEINAVCFDYQPTRSREGPSGFLENFSGSLQTDGYAAYNQLETPNKITLLACMAHARRKFEQAKDNDPTRARYALVKIGLLYDIERHASEENLTRDQRHALRKEQAIPVMIELKEWLSDQLQKVLPQSAIGKAVGYTHNLWPRLEGYLDDGRYQIDNNAIENTIRPLALGRKNYLFTGSHDAAQRIAIIYSLLGTCKLRGVEPYAWLKDVFDKIPDHPVNRVHELLPGANQDGV